MPTEISCKQLFGKECPAMFGGQNPQEFMNVVWEHIHKESRHADLQEELRKMREGKVKKWQDRLVHKWQTQDTPPEDR
ncbi:MAG: hypothetical protein RL681_225 [Candidatus Parcubacteria bacterium]|jgi:hypothetical protein